VDEFSFLLNLLTNGGSKMKNSRDLAFVIIIVGFVMLNILAGIFYRYNEIFNTAVFLYLWLFLALGAFIVLLWGIKLHLASFKKPKKSLKI
jgi:hypothetical protein